MNVTIIGTGYVGLVSGVCLASKGHRVRCVDLRTDVVEQLNQGVPHIHEEGLEPLLKDAVSKGLFSAHLPSNQVFDECEVAMIAVGTPSSEGEIDLSQVRSAAEVIGAAIKESARFISVVVKSTVLPTSTDTFVKNIIEDVSGKKLGDFGLGMNPEFLREGVAVSDFLYPDRIVFGYEDPKTLNALEELYSFWSCDKIAVNTRTAELIKYANNSLLALQISAINEIANVAALTGNIDMQDVVSGVISDKRWSPIVEGKRITPEITTYLVPGCGFGGSCFPKDVQALRTYARSVGVEPRSLQATLDINQVQPLNVVVGLEKSLGDLKGKKILVLGMAFKPGTDDVRESASLKIVKELADRGALVKAHDPIAFEPAKRALSDLGIDLHESKEWREEARLSDAVILATMWDEYKSISEMDGELKGVCLFDARRMFSKDQFKHLRYLTIGYRPTGES